ncbi:MAG: type II toxin-antitoxin system RelE/ParE family toxin [Bacteroidota bacterium]
MIISFRHKGLQELFEDGETRRLPQSRLEKIFERLAILDSAGLLQDLNRPGFRLHQLKGSLDGYLSINVTGNYRLIFRFVGANVFDVDFLDTH